MNDRKDIAKIIELSGINEAEAEALLGVTLIDVNSIIDFLEDSIEITYGTETVDVSMLNYNSHAVELTPEEYMVELIQNLHSYMTVDDVIKAIDDQYKIEKERREPVGSVLTDTQQQDIKVIKEVLGEGFTKKIAKKLLKLKKLKFSMDFDIEFK